MGEVGRDRTRPLTEEHARAPKWCGRRATRSTAMGAAECACSIGGESVYRGAAADERFAWISR
jgi:hypothetical protein